MTTNADPDKYGYIKVLNLMVVHNFHCWSVIRVKMIFFFENGSFRHTDNRKKDIAVLSERSTDG